ncbi:hypothetical protein [Glycomyces sp. NPDC021274]|uniref:hypothetical protein n=1 Tax=Glycomyces sp. NPDC021274 TaxID=3155120 RepID=UPI00340052D7
MLLLQPYRGRSRLNLSTAQHVLGNRTARRAGSFAHARDALNLLLEGTGLRVSAIRSGARLAGTGHQSDLDNLIRDLRHVETATSTAEVLEFVDRAVDVGPGMPLEALGGVYFHAIREGFVRAWEAAAFGWWCAATAVRSPASEERLLALFGDKAPGLEPSIPALARAAEDTLSSATQDDQLTTVKAVIGEVVDDIERHLAEALAEGSRAIARAANRTRKPGAPELASRAVAFEVSIYLGDGQEHRAVEDAVEGLLTEADIVTFGRKPPEIGSWFRRFWARTQAGTAHLSAEQVAAELERKLRIEVFDKAQAVIDNQQATGAAALIAALQGERHACIRVGSLLVLKVNGKLLVNTLTQYQLAWLERNQNLLRDPAGLLQGLETLTAEPTSNGVSELPVSDLADIELDSSSP